MVRKGSPVRVRQRASGAALQCGFPVFGAAWVTTSQAKGSGHRSEPDTVPSVRARCGAACHRGTPRQHVGSSSVGVPSGYGFVEDDPVSMTNGSVERRLRRFGFRDGSKGNERARAERPYGT